jgi:hypothetical protein
MRPGAHGPEQVGHLDVRPGEGGPEAEQLEEAGVADDQTLVGVGHAQALRHIVQRGVEARVLDVQVAVALLQHQVLEVGVLNRRLGPLVRGGEFAARFAEVGVEGLHLVVGAPQQPVVPDENARHGEAANDQPEQDAGEGPVQPPQFLEVPRGLVAALHVRRRREPPELRVQVRQHGHEPRRRLRPVEGGDQRFRHRGGGPEFPHPSLRVLGVLQ